MKTQVIRRLCVTILPLRIILDFVFSHRVIKENAE